MADSQLVRSTTLWGAVVLGLGAIIGTGAYVSIALATEMTGSWVLLAILIAAFVAACNGLSSAQLAAVHPVSGGTYEYGYKFLNHWAGFTAGWLFVAAKSASAATAALAFGLYLMPLLGLPQVLQIPLALLVLLTLMLLVNSGVRRSNQANLVIIIISISALLIFALFTITTAEPVQREQVLNFDTAVSDGIGWRALLGAAALLFVAYTGYGRIATMGEEVMQPRRTIPKAIALTVIVTTALYLLIGYALLHTDLFTEGLAAEATEVALVALTEQGWLRFVLLVGASLALLGVILNLILGVSRVVLAMGRRADLPRSMATLNSDRTSAPNSVYLTVAVMAALALLGDVELAWSFSAFTVLTYYGITNLAALKVPAEQRFVPRIVSVAGLMSCFGLIFFIDMYVFIAGCVFILIGLLWHSFKRTRQQ
ncbi:APC family permease [Aliidiomarina maris]|uniref:Amino acid transporter n=1 Tax=Aliidiomarina maris TaxID=531312 RepID=A0A327WN28_9GAMM|nr:APC family permease [Aliidiomarina maris]MCL5049186.1 APC family permease [Bacillota bacterium]RAJ92894.1 amino acid/polyamine/organocation transporter (APC superfamily) [Aliidiomarina maris]RUO18099.1 amino acid transporter [Aliidiomarina maris]